MGPSFMIVGITSVIAWLYIYGFTLICIDTALSSFPLAIFGSLILFFAYQYFKLPPPENEKVDLLLGPDPWLYNNNEDADSGNVLSESTGNGIDTRNSKANKSMKVIAHRGAGLDAPENSLASFRKCKERGCTAVEFDVSLTADGIPVIFHDRLVDRVSDGTGELSSMTLNDVKKLDISFNHAFREWYKGERVPTLEEAIQECLNLGLNMFIDLKDNDVRLIPHVLALFGVQGSARGDGVTSVTQNEPQVWRPPPGTDMHSKAVVTTFHPYLIYLIRRADPRIICTLAWRPFAFSSESYSASAALGVSGVSGSLRRRYSGILSNLGARIADEVFGWCVQRGIPFYVLGLSAFLVHKDLLSPELLRQWRERGVRIIAWTVNNPAEKQYFSKILKIAYITDTLDAESNHHITDGLDLAATR